MKKNTVPSGFVGKSSDKTKILASLTRKATADEIHQSRSVTQSLAWIARQTRPDLSYRISKIQSTFEIACVRDLRECNCIVECATSTSTRGSYFSPGFSWNDAVVATISDASFCQEQEPLDKITENFKSQQACITALALGNALNAEKMLIHPLSWITTRIRRVCCSTLMAEACALSNAVEHGLRTRGIIFDMRGRLNVRQWEETASAAMGHVWFTDCESLCAFGFSQYKTSRQQTFCERLVCFETTHLRQPR